MDARYLNPFEDDDTINIRQPVSRPGRYTVADEEEGEIATAIEAGGVEQLPGFDFILDNAEVDESFLHKIEVLAVLQGNLSPIDDYLDEIAYKNLDYKLSQHPKADQIRKLLKV